MRRLSSVDAYALSAFTPETGQPFGQVAKQFTSKIVLGKKASAIVKDVDRYGRTVAVVMVGNINLNQSFVKNGYAWWYRKYAPTDYTLKQLEFAARTAKRSLWADKSLVAPWDWRSGSGITRAAAAICGAVKSQSVSKRQRQKDLAHVSIAIKRRQPTRSGIRNVCGDVATQQNDAGSVRCSIELNRLLRTIPVLLGWASCGV